MLRRKRADPEAPEGVRIVLADGSEIPCDVLRDPEQDHDGMAVWVVVPQQSWTPQDGDLLKMAVLPAHTSLVFGGP
jgi:hypothetical protein